MMPHGLTVAPRRSPGGNPYNAEYLNSAHSNGQLTLSYGMLPPKSPQAATKFSGFTIDRKRRIYAALRDSENWPIESPTARNHANRSISIKRALRLTI